VLLDPFRIEPFGQRVLIGGTDHESELSYQGQCTKGDLPDWYIPLPENGPSFLIFPDILNDSRTGTFCISG
jgi:hypothetical protein